MPAAKRSPEEEAASSCEEEESEVKAVPVEAEEDSECEDSEWDEDEDELPSEDEEFDMFERLGVPRECKNPDRVRSEFHKRMLRTHLSAIDRRQCALAFLTLKDNERRRIYKECGWNALKQSEDCAENSIFDEDHEEVITGFFEGWDDADREYLMIHGPVAHSDDEELEEWEEQDAAELDEEYPATQEEIASRAPEPIENEAEMLALMRRAEIMGTEGLIEATKPVLPGLLPASTVKISLPASQADPLSARLGPITDKISVDDASGDSSSDSEAPEAIQNGKGAEDPLSDKKAVEPVHLDDKVLTSTFGCCKRKRSHSQQFNRLMMFSFSRKVAKKSD